MAGDLGPRAKAAHKLERRDRNRHLWLVIVVGIVLRILLVQNFSFRLQNVKLYNIVKSR